MKTIHTFYMIIAAFLVSINPATATIFTVQVANFSFTPSTLTIQNGDTVRWLWVSGTHTTTSTSVPGGASGWDNPITSASTQFDIKFTVNGTYSYYCSIHPTQMTGTITVNAASGLNDNMTAANLSVKTFPSPFTDNLTFSFSSPEKGNSQVNIYDLAGNRVKVIDAGISKTMQQIRWDGKDEKGVMVKPGIYFFTIERTGLPSVSGKIIKV